LSVLSRNSPRDCVCSVSRSRHRESDTGADYHWMGGLCTPGARASAKSERTRIHPGGAVAGRLAHAHYDETPASEHSSTSADSGHYRNGRSHPAESTLSFLGLGVLAPVPSWGPMVNDARGHLFDATHLVVFS